MKTMKVQMANLLFAILFVAVSTLLKLLYADTAKVLNNVPKGKEISIDSTIMIYKQDHELFSSISFVAEEDFFEMVLTDDGETWVNY